MRRAITRSAALALAAAAAALAPACSGPQEAQPSLAPTSPPTDVTSTEPPPPSTAAPVATIATSVSAAGDVVIGGLADEGFVLSLPADAYPGVAGVVASRQAAATAPGMDRATVIGDGYLIDTGGVGRLDARASLTVGFDPAATPDPMLLALAYHDGAGWTFIPAGSVDLAASTVTFSVFHFSAYYPARFTSELDAARSYAEQLAVQKVLGERGGDPRVASQQLGDFLASKLGLGDDEFSRRMLADIAADQDLVKLFDQYQAEGWSDTGYEHVMDDACGKVVELLSANSDALAATDGAGLSTTAAAFQHMGELLRIGGQNGARFLGYLVEGDTDAAARELFDLATDYTGLPGKAIKYTLQGMQNAVDVWRDGEVEKAFQVYTKGSSGTLFGYGAIDPKDFDAVWEQMKGASRQLTAERIAAENDARALIGLEPLSPREEDFYREKVKDELRAEFDRRIALEERIAAHRANLELIFAELDAAKLFDGTNVWIRSLDDPYETLESRLNRFNRLIERIMADLDVDRVYDGPQNDGPLGGRISAAAMGEMVRGYFAANTQAEGEAFLQDYYRTLGYGADTLDGHWVGTMTVESIECPLPYGCGGLGRVYQITFDLRTDAAGVVTQGGSSVDGTALPPDPSTTWNGTTLVTTLLPSLGNGDVLTGTAVRDAQGVITTLSGTWYHESNTGGVIYRGSWTATRPG